MSNVSVFVFDSTYPSADVAMPIDDTVRHIIVSDRDIEPPPGHSAMQIEEAVNYAAWRGNLQTLRVAYNEKNCCKCIVMAAPTVRAEQLLSNAVYAITLCWNVVFFDGLEYKTLGRSWRLILGIASRVLGKRVIGRLKAKIEEWLVRRRLVSDPGAKTKEGRLFGVYTKASTFSLPLDEVVQESSNKSIYGDYTTGWYLPELSNRRERYAVRTTRHILQDIALHVEDIHGSPERFLFRGKMILDYPYLLNRSRRNANYLVSTRKEVSYLDRGIDLLHYTPSYYHWLLDGVPRILDLIDDGIDFDQYPLIMQPLEAFQRELLEILGISPDSQVVTCGTGDWCHVGECIMPTAYFPFAAPDLENPSGQPNATLLRRIRERLMERIAKTSIGPRNASKKLYISRAEATRRKLTPQAEASVRAILETSGFRTVILERLPWAEQVLLVSGAETIVGLHGAGLANMLFAKAKSLLEFQNPLEARSYFAVMARELDMNYAYIVGKLLGESNNFDNITINPWELRELLGRLGVSS